MPGQTRRNGAASGRALNHSTSALMADADFSVEMRFAGPLGASPGIPAFGLAGLELGMTEDTTTELILSVSSSLSGRGGCGIAHASTRIA